MEHLIAKLMEDFERGKMTRRQLIQSFVPAATATATAGAAVPAAAEPKKFRALAVNCQREDWQSVRLNLTIGGLVYGFSEL